MNIDLNIILKTALTHCAYVLLSNLAFFSCTVIIIQHSVFFFLIDLNNISPQYPENVFIKILLYGNPIFDENYSQEILKTSLRYILD